MCQTTQIELPERDGVQLFALYVDDTVVSFFNMTTNE
jgi:hypothetical protein